LSKATILTLVSLPSDSEIFFSFKLMIFVSEKFLTSKSSFSKLGFKFSRLISGIVIILSSAKTIVEKINKKKS